MIYNMYSDLIYLFKILKSNKQEENVIKFSDLLSNMKSREDYYLVESEVESLIKEIKVGL